MRSVLVVRTTIPPSKNNKKTVFETQTGEVRQFYRTATEASLSYRKEINNFLYGFDPEKELLSLEIFLHESSDRRDVQNCNEILCDGLQLLLGVNDKYMIPRNNPRVFDEADECLVYIERIENLYAMTKKAFLARIKAEKKKVKKEIEKKLDKKTIVDYD